MRRARTRRGADRGAAAVEFALLFPLFLMLVFGIIGMGFGFNQKINLTQAAREASRYGATLSLAGSSTNAAGAPNGTVDTWLAKVQSVAKAAAGGTGGDLDPANRSRVYICVAYVTAAQTKSLTLGSGGPAASAPCYADGRTDDRVQVVVRSQALVDFVFFGGHIDVGSQSVTRFEAVPTT